MTYSFSSDLPLFMQVAKNLADAIFTGLYRADEQLPSTNAIREEGHINPPTVRKGRDSR